MTLFLITTLIFGFVIFIMAIGVIFGNRRIKGSCGGLACDLCSLAEKKKCHAHLNCPDADDNEELHGEPSEPEPRSFDDH